MNLQSTMNLAPHETLEIHELLRAETIGCKKLEATISMVQDSELKQFMQDNITAKKNAISNIQQLLSQI